VGVWVNDASAYRRTLPQTADNGRRFRVTVRDLLKVANYNFSVSVLFVLGLLVVTERCAASRLMDSPNYFDDTSTVGRRSHRTLWTDLIFIDDVSMFVDKNCSGHPTAPPNIILYTLFTRS